MTTLGSLSSQRLFNNRFLPIVENPHNYKTILPPDSFASIQKTMLPNTEVFKPSRIILNEDEKPNALIESIYSLGKGLLEPSVFDKISTVAKGLPELNKAALAYLQNDTPSTLGVFDRFQQLVKVLLQPNTDNFDRLSLSGSPAERNLQKIIRERLEAEEKGLEPYISERTANEAHQTMGQVVAEKPLRELAIPRANMISQTLQKLSEREANEM
jgi:hypothetical protein